MPETKPNTTDTVTSSSSDGEDSPPAPSLRREPSFSRWCDEEGVQLQLMSEGKDDEKPRDSEEFELPLLNELGIQRSLGSDLDYNTSKLSSENEPAEVLAPTSSVSVAFVLKVLFYVLVWYTFSTCLTLYNKMLLGNNLGKFPAPLLMNTIHFSMQAVLSNLIMWFQSRISESSGSKMARKDYFCKVVPTALATALDINLSNESLVFITVTFATMCKSASPIFLLIFAFAFRLETPSFKLLGIMLVISFGVLLTVAKETEFEFWGFLFVMLAAVMSGFRWSMSQILLQKEEYGLKNPIALMSYVTPVMAVTTAFFSLFLDPWNDFKGNVYFDNETHIIRSCLLMLLGGALAFSMVLTEYILVSITSSVTVTVAGIVKEAVTIVVAVLYFHDQFTWLKGLGLFTIMVGVGLFNWYKYHRLKKSQQVIVGGSGGSTFKNGGGKYVILDDIELQDDTV